MSELHKKLTDFGLSEKEAKIYLALLELEAATVSEAAKNSGINRSSAYVVLEALRKKGIVGISDDKKVRRYLAASPETLLRSAITSAQKQEEIKSGIESIVPELKALHKGTKHRPIVKVFEGKEGLREVYYHLFSTKAVDLKVYANPGNIFKVFPDFMDHDKERVKRKIKMYAINPATKESRELLKQHPPPRAEIALVPEEKFKFSSDFAVYDNLVVIASPLQEFGIIIESKEMASMMRAAFDLSWEEAKRLNDTLKKRG